MFDYIKRLQGRPIPERKRAAKIIAASVSVIILLVWLSTFGLRNEKLVVKEEPLDTAALEDLKGAAADIYLNFKEVSNGLKDVKNNEEAVSETSPAISSSSIEVN